MLFMRETVARFFVFASQETALFVVVELDAINYERGASDDLLPTHTTGCLTATIRMLAKAGMGFIIRACPESIKT
jgi:hypothetical protein